jgi:hypothetical protein
MKTMATCRACGLWLGDDEDRPLCEECLGKAADQKDKLRAEGVIARYHRKTDEHPTGTVTHHGDCWFWSARICTCGLLHDMAYFSDDTVGLNNVYPNYWTEITAHTDALERARSA